MTECAEKVKKSIYHEIFEGKILPLGIWNSQAILFELMQYLVSCLSKFVVYYIPRFRIIIAPGDTFHMELTS